MMVLRRLKVFFLVMLTQVLFAQTSFPEVEQELAYQADVMMNAAEPQHRLRAMEAFNTLFNTAITREGSYDYSFDAIKWISKKMPEDQSFKIYTWEVDAGEGKYNYFGILQTKTGKIFPLIDHFKSAESFVDEEFDHEQWLGALYYNIMEGKSASGQKYYMLYGVNRWNEFENVKLVDVLFFTEEGIPYFGLPVFRKVVSGQSDTYYNRLLFKYAADAQMTVNYNEGMKMIMVDNLVRKMSRIPGQSETMVPDGTYVGYELKKGYWELVDQIAITPMDTAPRPKPVLDGRKNMDIRGKQKPQKGK